MITHEGWLLDLYADPRDSVVFWLIKQPPSPDDLPSPLPDDPSCPSADDPLSSPPSPRPRVPASPRPSSPPPAHPSPRPSPPPSIPVSPCQLPPRLRLHQDFPVTFYAAGPNPRLRELWRRLDDGAGLSIPSHRSAVERRDLFIDSPLRLMSIEVSNPIDQERLFARVSQEFPDLTYYDADIPLSLRHAARYGTFPLVRLRLTADETGAVQELQALDTPWELDPSPAPLRILTIEPDCDPRRSAPTSLSIRCERFSCRLSLEPARPLLINLAAILRRCDPDLIQTAWGDTWLLPYLLDLSDSAGLPLPLNRDDRRDVLRKREFTYFSYGQVIHRGQQVLLFGRWHIDIFNAMMFHDYGLDGILESARVTSSPVQSAARLSPGSGISAMQMTTALRSDVLVPWHKQQAEDPKSALELIHADQGGMVYQPTIGLHHDVAEIDFVSMYPSIMVYFNISPETVAGQTAARLTAAHPGDQATRVPALDLWIDQEKVGLIPRTLDPLLQKRISFKRRLASMPKWDPRRRQYQARSAAHKWLLVTCFGYLGYKNARFGRIEAHESVTAYSREALLRAKEAAEDLGFEVLHMYVDGLWVRKPGCSQVPDFQPLLEQINLATHLPIALEGIYRWVAFLPSRVNPKTPVANRYFGAFQDGSLKVRGIEARRRDAPQFISQTQLHLLELMAQAADPSHLREHLSQAIDASSREKLPQPSDANLYREQLTQAAAYLRRQLKRLRLGQVPLEDLVVTQKLSRDLSLYHVPSPAGRAAEQLVAQGKTVCPGEGVRFIYTLGDPGVHAWDQLERLDPRRVDLDRYKTLLLRASAAVLQPFGVDEQRLPLFLAERQLNRLPVYRISSSAPLPVWEFSLTPY